MPNQTNITPPRVPLNDERTGLISREWYRFFLNLFVLTGEGTNQTSLTDLQVGPPPAQQEDLNSIIVNISDLQSQPSQESALDQLAEVNKQLDALAVQPLTSWVLSQIAELQSQIDAFQVTPPPTSLGSMAFKNTGATGFFTTVDLKTVTVTDGIIVSIV